MTYKQKLQIEHPEAIDDVCWGGCWSCPSTYGYCDELDGLCDCGNNASDVLCTKCWNREIPGTEPSEEAVERVPKEESNPIDTTAPDVVNHPSHYENARFECIDVMVETQGVEAVKHFCLCNAFKYLYRHNRKNGLEDIRKAQWYINKYIELEEQK